MSSSKAGDSADSGAPEALGKPWWRRRGVVVAFVLAAGAWGIARGLEPLSSEQWVRVERRDLVIGAEVEGELQAADSAGIGPPQLRRVWNFKISFMAPEGAEVSEGQPVLGFDTTELQRRLQEKVAERDSAIKEHEKQIDGSRDRTPRPGCWSWQRRKPSCVEAELKLAVPGPGRGSATSSSRRASTNAWPAYRINQARGQPASHLDRRRRGRPRGPGRVSRDQAAARVRRDREVSCEAMTVEAPRAGTIIYEIGASQVRRSSKSATARLARGAR